jgi:2-polyprenyl-6-methoxyphenol hydroxylase-like FAD-dependent oxidoreductase
MENKTVAIAGAGIAGYAAAAAFVRHGFKVRIYERSQDPREFGAGLYLKENSLTIFDRLGLSDRIEASGARLLGTRLIDEKGRTIVQRSLNGERLIVALRADVHTALRDAAIEGGAELITNTKVRAASAHGVLHLDDGTDAKADLVIGADGLNSRVRESLGLTRINAVLGDGATRVLIPREEEAYASEYWSGQRRVGVAPCSDDQTYVFIIGPEKDPRGVRLPLDRAHWTKSFPHLESIFARVADDAGVHHPHSFVLCKQWSKGRAVIIGDAAHAQPPNFGQGAGLAIAASWQLAETLAGAADVETGLQDWERNARPRVDMVQRLTTAYDIAGYKWPPALAPLRSRVFSGLAKFPATSRKWEYYWRGGVDAPATVGQRA